MPWRYTAEEWTIYNVSGLVHPFHIHIQSVGGDQRP